MTNLNYSIKGKTDLELADYFSCSEKDIRTAIFCGAKTYQDIYDYLQKKRVDK